MMSGVPVPSIVDEATRKGSVVWVGLDDAPPRPAWYLWHDGSVWLVAGGLEQELPEATSATVSVRSKERQGGLLVTWRATVTPVAPGTPEWETVALLLHGRRLNPPDGEDQPARWARESTVLRLTPTGELLFPATAAHASPRPLPSPDPDRP